MVFSVLQNESCDEVNVNSQSHVWVVPDHIVGNFYSPEFPLCIENAFCINLDN